MLKSLRRAFRSRAAAQGVALALLIQFLCITAVICIAAALGVALGYGDATGIVATATLLASVPVSINGWGIREGAFAAGFALVGVPMADGVLISIVYGVGIMLAVSPGAVLWLGRWPAPPPRGESGP
jgi:hypothetical protein